MRAYIWDLDGTLIDSYPDYIRILVELSTRLGDPSEAETIEKVIKEGVLSDWLRLLGRETGRDMEEVWAGYRLLEKDLPPPPAIPGAKETLEGLRARGDRNFIFTHNGPGARGILERLGLWKYFEEVVTSEYALPRKPAPDGVNYLVDKYGLDRSATWYVGDRDLDAQCARNAGVGSILLAGPYLHMEPDHLVDRLTDILKI